MRAKFRVEPHFTLERIPLCPPGTQPPAEASNQCHAVAGGERNTIGTPPAMSLTLATRRARRRGSDTRAMTHDRPLFNDMSSDGTWPDVNAIIQDARERAGLSKQHAADLAGVSRELWRKWERGDVIPSHKSCETISKAVNVPLDLLLGAAELTRKRRKLRRLQEDVP